ncbi:lipopolysaccharide biosynthesis protein [Sphingomonas sp. 1P06PA]|uniref:lipopolysaccharide biosynthesis protein n=1 Tax=Sphingomonas sp. 1P06PA TaxID=554121 RepID=UPI0039A566C8
MTIAAESSPQTDESGSFGGRVRSALIWRSGSQIVAQLVMWASTFLVIRLLSPGDYGLFAMTQIVMSLTALFNGYGLTGALVQSESVDRQRSAQVFGLLILMNGALAVAQLAIAPLAAAYFRQPVVADMIRVQALFHLLTPFIMMPQALLSRAIDFRTQARANIVAAMVAAVTALVSAIAGLGVWTLVLAPLAMFLTRAILLAVLGRWWIRPSFDFRGAGGAIGFGGAMLLSEALWFVQTQADVFIGGRWLTPADLGAYTTAVFLSQIVINKFLPALNDVAFPAYARLQGDRAATSYAFLKAVRMVMLVVMPFSLGLAVTAEPLVLTMLGDHWAAAVPIVALLGLATPFVALRTLYQPITNALGRPGIMAAISGAGAVIMPIAFLVGARHGAIGMAWGWVAGFPLLALIASILSLPVIGVRAADLARAIAPSALAGITMAVLVLALESQLPPLAPIARLALLVPAGALAYFGALALVARPLLAELWRLARRRAG